MADIETIALDTRYFNEATAPATPASGKAVTYVKSSDKKLYLKDDAGTETLISSGASLSNPMTTAGDIIQSSDGSGTPARLALGSQGSSLRAGASAVEWQKNNLAATAAPDADNDVDEGYTVGSAWFDTTNDEVYFCIDNTDGAAVWKQVGSGGGSSLSTGSSFPGSPSTGDRYRRSDLDYLVFFYDGTRWLSESLQSSWAINVSGETITINAAGRSGWGETDVYLVDALLTSRISSTNNGSHYWTFNVVAAPSSTNIGSVDTSGDTADVYAGHTIALDYVLDVSADPELIVGHVKTGSPGSVLVNGQVTWRYIAT